MSTWEEASRSGTAILTYSGRVFDFAWPTERMAQAVCIHDIAHALARICRYTGHVSNHRSVAAHCMDVEDRVWVACNRAEISYKDQAAAGGKDMVRLYALLHDAAEAYVGDVSAPLKAVLGTSFRILEERVQSAIYTALEMGPPPASVVELIHKHDQQSREAGLERYSTVDMSVHEGQTMFLERYYSLRRNYVRTAPVALPDPDPGTRFGVLR